MKAVEFTIKNTFGDLAHAAAYLDRLVAGDRHAERVAGDMHVALEEALTNIIRYAYSDDRIHEIRIRLTMDDASLRAEIEDDGKPFNPLAAPPPNLTGTLEDRLNESLGIHIMKEMMSAVSYSFVGNRNRLVLEKHCKDEYRRA